MEKNKNNPSKSNTIMIMSTLLLIVAFLLGIVVGTSLNENKEVKENNNNKTVEKEETNQEDTNLEEKTTETEESNEKHEEEPEENNEQREEETKENNEQREEEQPNEEPEEIVKNGRVTDAGKEMVNRIIASIPAKYKKVKANDFSNQEKLNLAFFHTDYFENEIVTQEELKESMIKLLGNNTTYTDETIRSLYYPEERVAIYDKNKQTYTYTSETAHGHTATEILYYIDSYKFNGEILLVTTYRLYYLHGDIGPVTEIYKDYDLKTKIEVDNKYCMKEYGDDICAIDYETYIKEHKNNAERITYTFNLSNNYPTFIEMK